ncbi:SAM-dependent chlorinase/fluorinase [bacterium]|nr:SAM-dependent chlorinase/fluorinase [bacterium]
MKGLVTLTSDFGTQDAYVGSLHGAVYSTYPKAVIADISHHIASYNIADGAFVLGVATRTYPQGTVHVGVVDPGVGSSRKPIIVEADGHFFVGPDNGLFSLVYLQSKKVTVYEITNKKYFPRALSSTFHGRDLFCPVAAHLAKGVKPSRIGTKIKKPVVLDLYQNQISKQKVSGRIVYIDKFGNCMTSIPKAAAIALLKKKFTVTVKNKKFSILHQTYSQVPVGKPVMVFSSHGLLEMARFKANLATLWKLKVGDKVTIVSG